MNSFNQFLNNATALMNEIRRLLPPPPPEIDWENTIGFVWRRHGSQGAGPGHLEPVLHPQLIDIDDLQGNQDKFERIEQNTRQFVSGRPANNALLTGARGTGKSSIVKALLKKYADQGLRLIEVEKELLTDLPAIVAAIRTRPERFIIFCDDLSFDAEEPGYKALKVMLDGSITAPSEKVLIYATSNRRHLVPEYMRENTEVAVRNGEIHQSDSVDEKISLSERFGIWVHFYPFEQNEYLAIVEHWLLRFNPNLEFTKSIEDESLGWALQRGSRSGRVALQFARDYCGRNPS
ncbi:ATP-binding protein [Noviherbaspirillum saxi]|uniref:ATP-binding protein n=1 Tax=Noviherbaspirillum saxi TaxID=2320863 RepID=A0A3A3G459_9BURK|nr:ATP-binding protein [Noviherbaspirillum saxi]RJF96216.1 ATP-binding protein [Noviherbaspirillum saxi]